MRKHSTQIFNLRWSCLMGTINIDERLHRTIDESSSNDLLFVDCSRTKSIMEMSAFFFFFSFNFVWFSISIDYIFCSTVWHAILLIFTSRLPSTCDCKFFSSRNNAKDRWINKKENVKSHFIHDSEKRAIIIQFSFVCLSLNVSYTQFYTLYNVHWTLGHCNGIGWNGMGWDKIKWMNEWMNQTTWIRKERAFDLFPIIYF